MPTEQILALLIEERDRLNRAIEALDGTGPKRRGRPPKAVSATTDSAQSSSEPAARKRKGMSAAQRKAAATTTTSLRMISPRSFVGLSLRALKWLSVLGDFESCSLPRRCTPDDGRDSLPRR